MTITLINHIKPIYFNRLKTTFRTRIFSPLQNLPLTPFFTLKSLGYNKINLFKNGIWCGRIDFKIKLKTIHIPFTGLSTGKLHKTTQNSKNPKSGAKNGLQAYENKGTIHDKS